MDEKLYKIKGQTKNGKEVCMYIDKFNYSILNSMQKFGMKKRITINPAILKTNTTSHTKA